MSQISTGDHLYFKQYWIWTVFSTCRVPGFVLDPVLGRVYPKQVTSHWEVCKLSTLAEGSTELTLFPTRLRTHVTHWPSSLWGLWVCYTITRWPQCQTKVATRDTCSLTKWSKIAQISIHGLAAPSTPSLGPSRDGGRGKDGGMDGGMEEKWLFPLHPCTPHSRCRLGLHRMTYPLLIRGLD